MGVVVEEHVHAAGFVSMDGLVMLRPAGRDWSAPRAFVSDWGVAKW